MQSPEATNYLRAAKALERADAARGDATKMPDDTQITFYRARLELEAARAEYEETAPDVAALKSYLVSALQSCRAELSACDVPPVDAPSGEVSLAALEAYAGALAAHAAAVDANAARLAAARSRVACAFAAFTAFETLARDARAAQGLPRLPRVLPLHSVPGIVGAPRQAPRTAAEVDEMLAAIADAAAAKPAGKSSDEMALDAVLKSRELRLAREAETLAANRRSAAPLPWRGTL